MWFKLVINFMLPMELLIIMLKTQFVIHNKTYLKYNLWSGIIYKFHSKMKYIQNSTINC